MLPPNNMAIRHLSQEEGISEATLHKWRAEARGKGHRNGITLLVPVATTQQSASLDFATKLSMDALHDLLNMVNYSDHEHGAQKALDDTATDAIHGKGAHKAICHTAKQNFVEPFGYENTTIIPECLLTEITIRLDAHIKRVMPSHVASQGFNRSRVTQVMQLLQEQHANDDVQIFRRAP